MPRVLLWKEIEDENVMTQAQNEYLLFHPAVFVIQLLQEPDISAVPIDLNLSSAVLYGVHYSSSPPDIGVFSENTKNWFVQWG